MGNMIIKEFSTVLGALEDKDYLISTIAYSTAPTLNGQKPSNLITFSKNKRNLYTLWENYKDEATHILGLNYHELYSNDDRYVVLFYHRDMLKDYVFNASNMRFLKTFGYSDRMNIIECLDQLKKRFNDSCPHELGIFLGIPLGDVQGFIEYAGKQCLLCKYWKVYDDLNFAKCTFESYDQAKTNMMMLIIKGYQTNKRSREILKFSA